MNALIITKREILAFFDSPLAYMVGAVFLFITGVSFFSTAAMHNIATLTQVFNVIGVALLFITPVLTMRLLSEEVRSGTLELLLTAPIRDWEIVLGKFLAAFLLFAIILTPTLYYLFLLIQYDNPDISVTFSGYLGIILLGAMLISLGVLTSALSANQIIAAILAGALSLFFWLAGGLGTALGGSLGDLFTYLSIQEHFTDFLLGLITLNNIVYFLSITAGALFITTHILEARRCR